ncbi:hypothetical protein CS0771_45800 [Catellatospora sp. IY07-71]|uniref:IPT/TIG domain-containing protein n=1 Tax=Catellatospora sp. IY07-71 TaxID=2728827 RepID=UPI001BB3B36E|nr:IPT/TIG domain-containing protein [Catellatospora sp. IY07-71]BCJ75036.1 hypothetical protein CS0771_45800 [Catellatospora sp. IY07-71]
MTIAMALAVGTGLAGPAAADDPVTVDAITPRVTAASGTLSISGRGFSTTPSDNLVRLNGTALTVTAATEQLLEVGVPAGATSGPITVQSPTGAATSAVDVYVPPAAFTPAQVETYQRIASGTPATATVATAGNISLLTVAGQAGRRLSIKLASSTFGTLTSSARISVYRPDGTALLAATGFGSSGIFIEPLALPSDGTYQILIDPQNTAVGQVAVTAYDLPADQVLALTPGTPVTMSATVPGANATATFTGVAGQRVALQGSGGTFTSSSHALLSIRRPDGTVLVSGTSCGTSCWIDTKTLPADGVYTVLLDAQSTNVGSLTVKLTDVPPDQAHTLTPASTLTLTTSAGQNAVATFPGTAGERVALRFTGGTYGSLTNATVSLAKPDGTTLVSSTYCGTSCWIDTKTLPADGVYTLLLDPQTWYTGSLTAELFLVPADGAYQLIHGTPVTITTTAGQNAVATFPGTAGGRVALRFTGGTYGSSSYLQLVLRKPDGTNLVSTTYCGTSCWIDTKTLPADGVYTVVLDAQSWNTGSLTAQLFTVVDPVVAAAVGGPAVAVTTTTPGQNATVTFPATAGQRVSVQLSGSTYGTSSSSVSAALRNPDGSTLLAAAGVGSGGLLLGPVTIGAGGTHTVVLDPANDLVGALTVLVSDVADATAQTTAGAGPVTVGTTSPGQNARVSFPAADGDRVAVRVSASTYGSGSSNLQVSVLRPDGTVLVPATGVGSSGAFIDARVLSGGGTYQILVDPQGAVVGSVQVEVIAVPADTSAEIPLDGTTVRAATTVAGQNAALTFPGEAGQRVSIRFANGSGSVYATVTGPDGTVLKARWSVGAADFTEPLTLPASGQYRILLDPSTAALGVMDVQAWLLAADPTAAAVLGGDPATVTITAPGQNATVTVDGTAGTRLSLRLSGTVGVYATVKKPDGTDLKARWYASTSDFADPLPLPVTGTYTVVLDPLTTNVGTTSVQAYDVPADPVHTATLDGTPVTATVAVPGQNAAVTFDGTAGQRVSLQTTSPMTVYATIRKPDGTDLKARWSVGQSSFLDPLTLPATGTYTLLLDPNLHHVGDLTARLWSVPADLAGTATLDGSPHTVSIGVPGQNAQLAFTGQAGHRVYVQAETVGTFTGSVKVSVRDAANTTLGSATVSASGAVFVGPVAYAATGGHTIVVDPQGATTGAVRIRVWDATSASAAEAAVGGEAVTVTTQTPGQAGLATFTGTAGQRVSITVTGAAYLAGGVQQMYDAALLGPSGSSIATKSASSPASALLGAVVLPADGAYTVRVLPRGLGVGTAQVRVHAVPADVALAGAIGGGPVSAALTAPGAAAVITFTATAGQSIITDVYAGPAPLNIVVTRPDGTTECSSTSLSLTAVMMCTARQSGEHRLRFTPATVDTGTWSVELVDLIGTPAVPAAAEWSGADVSLSWKTFTQVSLAGYAVVLDGSPGTDPGSTVTQVADSLSARLPDGLHYLHVRAVATTGLAGPAAHITVKVDATAPVMTGIQVPSHPDPDVATASLTVQALFTASDTAAGVAGYAVSVTRGPDDEPLGAADAEAAHTLTLAGEGTWYLHVAAVDRAGNRGTPMHRRLTVDLPPSAPHIASSTHPVPGTVYPGQDFVATWTSGPADAARWAAVLDGDPQTVPGTAATTAQNRFGGRLAAGEWWLHVRGIDAAGTAGQTAHFRVVVAPRPVAFQQPLPGRAVWGTAAVAITCPGGGPLVVEARTAGGAWQQVGSAAVDGAACRTSWDTTAAAWPDGRYELRARDGDEVVADGVAVTVANGSDVLQRLEYDYAAGALELTDYVRFSLYAVVQPGTVPAVYTTGAVPAEHAAGARAALVGLFADLPAAAQQELSAWMSPVPLADPQGAAGRRSVLRAAGGNPDCTIPVVFGELQADCRAYGDNFSVYYKSSSFDGADQERPRYVQDALDTLESSRTFYVDELGYRAPGRIYAVMHPSATSFSGGLSLPPFPGCNCPTGVMFLDEEHGDIRELVRHEMFHFIQYEYMNHLYIGEYNMNWWMEATANWGAHQASEAARAGDDDYYYNLYQFLRESEQRYDEGDSVLQAGGPEYGAFILAEFMQERLGDDAIRHSWERLEGQARPLPGVVIGELLDERAGTDAATEIERFRQWAYVLDSGGSPVGFADDDADEWRLSLDRLPGMRPPHRTVTIGSSGDDGQATTGALSLQQTGAQYVELANPGRFNTQLTVGFTAGDPAVRASAVLLDEDRRPSAACGGARPVHRADTYLDLTTACPNAVLVFVWAEQDDDGLGFWTSGQYTISYARHSVDLFGVSDLGLGAYGNITSTSGIGLRRGGEPDTESVLNGCWCEGWGVGVPGAFGASVNEDYGVDNMELEQFSYAGGVVSSTVRVPDGLRVVQTTSASSVDELWELRITVYNTTDEPLGPVHYRRVVDWDPMPTLFDSYNTVAKIDGTDTGYLAGITNDGFANPDPSLPMTDLGATGWFQDYGPDDTGALLDVDLGTLAPGTPKTFSIFYGVTGSEAAAIDAVTAVGAQVYSLGQVATDEGRDSGLPYTAVMAIDGSALTTTGPALRLFAATPQRGWGAPQDTFLRSTTGVRPPQHRPPGAAG